MPITPAAEAVTKVRIARLITSKRCGSNLLLGASWLDPGEETNLWSSRDENDMAEGDHWYGPVDETYFIIRGRLRADLGRGRTPTSAPTTASSSRRAGLPPAQRGDEPAFFVYGMTPTPE